MAISEDFSNGIDTDRSRSEPTKLTEKVDLVIIGGEHQLDILESARTPKRITARHDMLLTGNSWTDRSTISTARTTARFECLYP